MPSVWAAREVSTTSLRWRKKLWMSRGVSESTQACRVATSLLVESANGRDLDGHTGLSSTENLDRSVDVLVGELCW